MKTLGQLVLDTTLRELLQTGTNFVSQEWDRVRETQFSDLPFRTVLVSLSLHIAIFMVFSQAGFLNQGNEEPLEVSIITSTPEKSITSPTGGEGEPAQASGLQSLINKYRRTKLKAKVQIEQTKESGWAQQELNKLLQSKSVGGSSKRLTWDNVGVEANESDQTIDKNSLIKVLNDKQIEFQKCFEKALFTDASIAGRASFDIHLGQLGQIDKMNIDFSGDGSGEGRKNLKKCLEEKSRELRFSDKFQKTVIKFNLMFQN